MKIFRSVNSRNPFLSSIPALICEMVFEKMAFEGGRCKKLQEFIEGSKRLSEQARSRVASAVNDSKSTPLDQQRSESSNTPLEEQIVEQASLDFQKAFPGLSCPACGRQIQTYLPVSRAGKTSTSTFRPRSRSSSPYVCNTWTDDFICLASTSVEETPTSIHLENLRRAGLGRKKIIFKNKNGDHNHIRQTLESYFCR